MQNYKATKEDGQQNDFANKHAHKDTAERNFETIQTNLASRKS